MTMHHPTGLPNHGAEEAGRRLLADHFGDIRDVAGAAVTGPDVHAVALELASHGLRVVPIIPGKKHPPVARWQEQATTDTAVIDEWWLGPYAGHGVGIASGSTATPGVNLLVVDVDVSDGKAGDETLHDLELRYGQLPDTVRAVTGTSGSHVYLTYSATVTIHNDASKRLGPGLDVRAEGGQVVAPPTVHPNGNTYHWEIDHAPGDLPIAPAPDWLIGLLTEQTPCQPPPIERHAPAADDGPAARFNARTTWGELLEADGWALDHVDRAGEQHWVRPGKNARDGTSATVGYEGRDVLRVFTTSLSWLPEGPYSRFGYYACRHHGGDRSVAARALLAEEGRMANGVASRGSDRDPIPDDEAVAPDGFRLTDAGNASRLVNVADGRLRYVHAWGRWIVYRNGRWIVDVGDALVTQHAKLVARALLKMTLSLHGSERDRVYRAAIRSESSGAIAAMVRLARGTEGVLTDHEHLDASPYLLNVLNGTIDLRSGELQPHHPDDLMTSRSLSSSTLRPTALCGAHASSAGSRTRRYASTSNGRSVPAPPGSRPRPSASTTAAAGTARASSSARCNTCLATTGSCPTRASSSPSATSSTRPSRPICFASAWAWPQRPRRSMSSTTSRSRP
jgi:hypothetical protein